MGVAVTLSPISLPNGCGCVLVRRLQLTFLHSPHVCMCSTVIHTHKIRVVGLYMRHSGARWQHASNHISSNYADLHTDFNARLLAAAHARLWRIDFPMTPSEVPPDKAAVSNDTPCSPWRSPSMIVQCFQILPRTRIR